MLAYSLITAILPLLLFILSIAALLLQPFVQANIDTVVAAITAALPRPVQSLIDVKELLNSLVAITGPLAISSLIGLVWLGSNLFVNVENAFSIIYRVRGRDVIAQRLVAIGMVLLLTWRAPWKWYMSSYILRAPRSMQHTLRSKAPASRGSCPAVEAVRSLDRHSAVLHPEHDIADGVVEGLPDRLRSGDDART